MKAGRTTDRGWRLVRLGILPRGLDRTDSATYVGSSPGHFDKQVDDKIMPQPKLLGDKLVWDIRELDEAFDRLPHRGETNGELRHGGNQEPDDQWRARL